MNILPLPAFTDNYIWLIEENGKATVVDPGDAEVVNNCLKEKNLELENILITHHHFDHTGGVEQLKKSHECNVYGPHDSPFNGVEIKLKEDDEISIHGLTFKIIEVPGHTLDHIAYYSEEQNTLFCGDTLFSGGCGRIFEGTKLQMYESINLIKNFPTKTKIFFGHEYTKQNSKFCACYDPTNKKLMDKIVEIDNKLNSNLSTTPTILADEIDCNIFLRTDSLSSFSKLRELKDNF